MLAEAASLLRRNVSTSPHASISVLALSLSLSALRILILVLPLVSACAGDPLHSLISMATADLLKNIVVKIDKH